MKRNTNPIKAAVFLFAAAVFILIIMPFSMTLLLAPAAVPEKSRDKTDAPAADDMPGKVTVPNKILVYRQTAGKVEHIAFEDYITCVVASEMPSSFEMEALKAQAVAARTYALSKYGKAQEHGNPSAHSNAPVCDTVHCQVYQDKNQLRRAKGSKWMDSDWEKISDAACSTRGQLMYYDGKLVEQALFHSSSGGKTENCEDVFVSAVPYLISVESPYEEGATHKKESLTLSVQEFSSKIKTSFPGKSFGTITASCVKVLSHSSGGRVEKVKIGSSSLSGVQVRQTLGLFSANFTISSSGNGITFTTKGSGHGVGMSQYGANGMAKKGYNYKEILTHYYSGTEIL